MSNTKTLKVVDWFIKVPEVSECFENMQIYSSTFTVTFKGKVTLWRLAYNLKNKAGNNFKIYIKRLSEPAEIDFDFLFKPSIVKSAITKSLKMNKSSWDSKVTDDGRLISLKSWGIVMTSAKYLKEKREELCVDGILQLRIAIDLVEDVQADSTSIVPPLIGKVDLKIDFKPDHSISDNIFSKLTSSQSDVLIKTDDGTILRANKAVLSEKSSVFQSMFTIDMEEATSKSVDIIDFKGPVMQELLRFIYFGNVHNIDQFNIELFKAAKVYEIAELPEICLKSITAGVDYKNVVYIAQFANVYDLDQLFNSCCAKIQRLRHRQDIQSRLGMLDAKLQIKILDRMNMLLSNSQIHVVVETCERQYIIVNQPKY